MERRFPLVEVDLDLARTLVAPLGAPIRSMDLLAGGHVNTNYVLGLDDGRRVVLRIYAHGEAAYRTEVQVLRALWGSFPVPRLLLESFDARRFQFPIAVLEWIDGHPLDAALSARPDAGARLGVAVSEALLGMRAYSLPEAPLPSLREFMRRCLFEGSAAHHLGETTASRLWAFVQAESALLDEISRDKGLVHGDFQGDNILLREEGDAWRVAGVLDWEWAHQGARFKDIGSLLRYDGGASEAFQRGIEEGFLQRGAPLRPDWRKLARISDLAAHCEKLAQPRDRGEVTRRSIRVIERCLADYAT
jgi:aminoglycoside phosphotransferase (APT) family kinase protein